MLHLPWSEEYPFNIEFQPGLIDGGSVDIQFKCPKCGEIIEIEQVEIPSPCMGENSLAYGESEPVECPNCNEEYNVSIANSFTHWTLYFGDGEETPDKFRIVNLKYNHEEQDEEEPEE